MSTFAEIATLTSSGGQCGDLTPPQVAAGFMTGLNVLKVFALVLGAVCLAFLFGRFAKYLVIALALVPIAAYEAAGYGLAFALLVAPAFFGMTDASWFIVPGGILWAATLALSGRLRKTDTNKQVYLGMITAVWAAAAWYYGDSIAGFGAVMSFMALTGFSVVATPLAYFVGFDSGKAVNRAGGVALLIVAALVLERMFVAEAPVLDPFRTAMNWLGPFVFSLAILVNSSRWYMDAEKPGWFGMQVMAVAAYFALIMAGSTYGLNSLLNIGSAFLILFLIEKPFEIRHRSMTGLAFTGLVVSIAIGGAVYWSQSNPDIVARWLPILAD
jgi:hypothetical protein